MFENIWVLAGPAVSSRDSRKKPFMRWGTSTVCGAHTFKIRRLMHDEVIRYALRSVRQFTAACRCIATVCILEKRQVVKT